MSLKAFKIEKNMLINPKIELQKDACNSHNVIFL